MLQKLPRPHNMHTQLNQVLEEKDTTVMVHLEYAAVAHGTVVSPGRFGGYAFLAHTNGLAD